MAAPSQSGLASMAPFPPVRVVENGNSITEGVPAGGVGKVGGSRLTLERLVIATSNRIRTFLGVNWPTAERDRLDVVAAISLAPRSAKERPAVVLTDEESRTVTVPAWTSTRTGIARPTKPVVDGGGS